MSVLSEWLFFPESKPNLSKASVVMVMKIYLKIETHLYKFCPFVSRVSSKTITCFASLDLDH